SNPLMSCHTKPDAPISAVWCIDHWGRTVKVKCAALHNGVGFRDEKAQAAARANGVISFLLYEGGHLLASRFGYGAWWFNLVAMSHHLNQGAYKKMENRLGRILKKGGSVTNITIWIHYIPNTKCPNRIDVLVHVNGVPEFYMFDNNGGCSYRW